MTSKTVTYDAKDNETSKCLLKHKILGGVVICTGLTIYIMRRYYHNEPSLLTNFRQISSLFNINYPSMMTYPMTIQKTYKNVSNPILTPKNFQHPIIEKKQQQRTHIMKLM